MNKEKILQMTTKEIEMFLNSQISTIVFESEDDVEVKNVMIDAIKIAFDDSVKISVPYYTNRQIGIFVCGLPGSGKDFFISQKFNLPVISLDELRRQHKIKPGDKYATGFIIQLAKEKAKEFLRKKQSFVWNATNLTKQIREQVIGLLRSYNAKVKIVYVEVDYKKLLHQNLNRDYPIPVIPSVSEAHQVEYYTNS